MANEHLPCLIFSSDGRLCDERDVLSVTDDILTLKELEKRFRHSLYGDADDFFSFCSSSGEDYRFYRLRCFSSCRSFRYAFCEKDTVLGERLTVVYLAHDIAAFHSLMSPSSGLLRGSADTLASELLEIKNSADTGETSLSAEAFSVASRIPYLCEAIFSTRSRARYCDLTEATRRAAAKICASAAVPASVNVNARRGFFSSCDSGDGSSVDSIIELPVEAYTAVLTLIAHIAASLSSTHVLELNVSYFSYAADIEVTTSTDKLPSTVRLAGPRWLRGAGVRDDLLRIAETIAYISGIELSVSFDKETGIVKITIGLGYEMQSIPDFKYSDPLGSIGAVADEIEALISSL